MRTNRVWLAGAVGALAGMTALAQQASEIGFSEEFALATNREAAIRQLVPGTDDYYFYTCLHLQNTGQAAKVTPLLVQWVKTHGETARCKEIRNRQMLLTYSQNPQATLDYLRREEGISFSHAQERAAQKNQFPARLDPQLVNRETLTRRAWAHSGLSGFQDAALEWLAGQPLNSDQVRLLLQRLTEPDVPKLPELILADLRRPDSGGFGSLNIHTRLTIEQLQACAAQMPDLLSNDRFVECVVRRLRPNSDSPWNWDPAAKRAYLDRLWAWISTLPASQSSLQAHILYHRLAFDRTQNVYDRDRFLAYLRLPRDRFYVHPLYRKQALNARLTFADLNRNYEEWTGFAPIGNDEPLVRDFLAQFLTDAADWKAFAELLEDNYLKEVFAETKLLAGVGEPDQWYNLMPPAKHQALRDRIDLMLLPQNPGYFGLDEPVKLRVAVKNVPHLTVQVFEIDTFNYYQTHDTLSTAIDLDGLAPGIEKTFSYAQAPMRRHEETIELPQIAGRGVYVVECIGNGVSSRAVIRKGRIVCSQRTGAAGHVFTVFNEKRERISDAHLWVGGQDYTTNRDGLILVPFTTGAQAGVPVTRSPAAGKRSLVRVGTFAEPVTFTHMQETYQLNADFWLDRESLVAGGTATVVVKPTLLCAGRAADLGLIEEPTLEIRAVDSEGVASTQRRTGLKFDNRREFVHTFSVPEGTRQVDAFLRGKVRNITATRDDPVAASASFACNGQDATPRTAACYLRHLADGWRIEVRGKTGESKAGQVVNLQFAHREFAETVTTTLQTDDNGWLSLGPLDGLVSLTASLPDGESRSWALTREAADYDTDRVVRAGEVVEQPLATDWLTGGEAARAASLFRLAPDNSLVEDARSNLTLTGRTLVIKDLAPGRYRLRLKDTEAQVMLTVLEGPVVAGLLLANTQVVEPGDPRPPRIADLRADDKSIQVQVANVSPDARLHLLARWSCADGAPSALGDRATKRARVAWGPPQSLYVSGRNIGDEYRYILDRRFAARQAGNMLDRPSLLLSPWSVRDTVSGKQDAAAGEAYERIVPAEPPAPSMASRARFGGGRAGKDRARGLERSGSGFQEGFDFLPGPALVLANLEPDKEGRVSVERAKLGCRTQVYAVLCDGENWSCRELALPDTPVQPRDRALRRTLPADQHLIERKIVSPVATQGSLVIEDIRSTRLELYDTLGKVFRLFQALNDNESLREFVFVTEWPKLTEAAKREQYTRHACHELDFFLYRKDPAFFQQTIKPFLAQKKDKQIVDDWLLERDLTRYLEPWEFQRLNAFERILLAKRLTDRQPALARHIHDRYELLPPDPEGDARRFLAALQGGSLDQAAPESGTAAKPVLLMADDGVNKDMVKGAASKSGVGGVAFAMNTPAEVADMPAKTANKETAKRAADYKQPVTRKALALRREGGAPGAARFGEEMKAEEMAADGEDRSVVRARYRSPDRTKEWVETQYYRVPLAQQTPELIPVNAFWNDWAAQTGKSVFLSPHVTDAAGTFSEMLLALAVLDLPFEAGAPQVQTKETRMTLQAASPLLAFHKEVDTGQMPQGPLPLLVGQNFFAADDPVRFEGSESFEKFVTGEFLAGRVYGARIVLTNPTSARRKVEALLQIPEGSVPVQNGFYTRTRHVVLEPYATQTLEYYFYFPASGAFRHYPVHASTVGIVAGFAAPSAFQVVDKLTQTDENSWPHVSQFGTDAQVLAFLAKNNIERLDLVKIAFRMKDKAFFNQTLDLLRARHVYNPVLGSYGIFHKDEPAIREYLRQSAIASRCGAWLDSDLLKVDAADRRVYEHREYWPLVNARAHRLGGKRTIQNDGLLAQVRSFMDYLSYRPSFNAADQLAIAVVLLLQDRVSEAETRADRVKSADVETRLQLDYLQAYLAFARGAPEDARRIAGAYRDYPVLRWRNFFATVLSQADEITGGRAAVANKDSREQVQDQLAATAPSLELTLDGAILNLRYRNVRQARVSYYPMDLELLFSRSPFVRDDVSGRFSLVKPAQVETLALPDGRDTVEVKLPEAFRSRNLLVEVEAGGVVSRQVFTPHALDVRFVPAYGQVLVRGAKDGKPMPAVYVKVYARFSDGSTGFYKDGYTDLRGRFDYASVSTDDLDRAEKFSLLIMSDRDGAVVREIQPPGK